MASRSSAKPGSAKSNSRPSGPRRGMRRTSATASGTVSAVADSADGSLKSVEKEQNSSLKEETLPKATKAVSHLRSISPRRAIVLAVVATVVVLTLAVPLRTFFDQKSELENLRNSNASLQIEVNQYRKKVVLQNDPAYIEAQARERLQFVMPGEKPLIVQRPGDGARQSTGDDNSKTKRLWYGKLWDAISVREKAKN